MRVRPLWAILAGIALFVVFVGITFWIHNHHRIWFNWLVPAGAQTSVAVLWSVGFSSYNAVYARIGTDAIAAVNINATIEELIFVLFIFRSFCRQEFQIRSMELKL